MRDLFRCLDQHPPELLRAIAGLWQVPLSEGEPREMALHLAEAMLAPGALDTALQALSPEARQALAEIVKEGGAAPGHRLLVRYGSIRRLGPAALAREQPWTRPESVLEELYYKGILYRAYATVADYYGEVYFIPQQLLEPLRDLDDQTSDLVVRRVPDPVRVERDGNALVEDLLALLVHIRQTRIAASAREEPPAMAPSLDQLDLGPRLLGASHPDRLALARQLLWRLGLLQDQRGLLRPSARARTWMRLPDLHRAQTLYLAWRHDRHWNELLRLSSLQSPDSGWHANPVAARGVLLGMLARCPPGRWLSLTSFVKALKSLRPDYLRPDGDYDSWQVRDLATGQYLSGFAFWDRIEGALARYIIRASLRWLGIVDVGYEGEDSQPAAFRITEQGWALLTREAEPLEPAEASSLREPATIRDDFAVTIPVEDTMYERYQLERFAEWRAQDAVATYQITPESVWRGYNAGVRTDHILRFLRRISQDQVPDPVLRALLAWGGRFGRATLARGFLLRTADADTMRQIGSHSGVRGLLDEALSPTACLVQEENVKKLIEQLKELGIWPLLRE